MTSLADLIKSGDTVFVGTGIAEPRRLIDELVELSAGVEDLRIIQLLTGSTERIADVDPDLVRILTPSPGPRLESLIREGRAQLLAGSLGQIARWIRHGELKIDVALAQRTAGTPLPGLVVDVIDAAVQTASFRAFELVDGLPEVPSNVRWHLDDADYTVRSDFAPQTLPGAKRTSPTAERIGQFIAELVPDGATIELGVGGSLSLVAEHLARAGRRRISAHTGLITDWVMDLARAGVLSGRLDCAGGASVVGTMVWGSEELYSWVHRNPNVLLVGSEHSHDPSHIGTLDTFVAINTALEVDLTGATNVTGVQARDRGTGGLLDFASTAAYSGTSIVAVPSHRIVTEVATASVAPEFVTHVVTELGIADLRGKGFGERAEALRAIAAPSLARTA